MHTPDGYTHLVSTTVYCDSSTAHPQRRRSADVVVLLDGRLTPVCRPCYRFLDGVIHTTNLDHPGAYADLPVITHGRKVGHA
jgi:hypothetical protein